MFNISTVMVWLVVFITITLFSSYQATASPTCLHDHFSSSFAKFRTHTKQSYTQDTWEPIRIYADFHNFTANSDCGFLSFLKNFVVPKTFDMITKVISVIPVDGPLLLQNSTMCGFATVPYSQLNGTGPGINSTDLVVYFTNQNVTSGDIVGYAAACQFDQNGRPIAGNLNVVPPDCATFNSTSSIDEYYERVLHDMIHILGFSYDLFGTYKDSYGKLYQNVTITSNETGYPVTKLVTPIALEKARQYFNCPTLDGIELQSNGGPDISKSHLEMRLFMNAIMKPRLLYPQYERVSPITLAILEDSSWYKIDYSNTNEQDWGANLGCPFLTKPCITGPRDNPQPIDPRHFCTKDKTQMCTVDRYAKGLCVITDYEEPLPEPFQYFNDPNEGGIDELLDYCPVYETFSSGAKTSTCTDPNNQPDPKFNFYGETYEQDSRCFESTLINNVFEPWITSPGIACYPIQCLDDYNLIKVKVGNTWVTCNTQPGPMTVDGFRGQLICPPYDQLCD